MKITGPFIKELRIEQGMTQKELAAEIIHQSTLSRFENDLHYSLSYDKLSALLKRLNISNDELKARLKRTPIFREFLSICKKLRTAELQHDSKFLDPLISSQERLWKQHHTDYYRLNAIMLKALRYVTDNSLTVDSEDIHFIQDYLDSVIQWEDNEFTLINNCMMSLEVDFVYHQIDKRIIKPFEDLTQYEYLWLINSSLLFIERSHLTMAQEIIDQFHSITFPKEYLYITNQLYYAKGLLNFCLGKEQRAKDLIEKALSMFETEENEEDNHIIIRYRKHLAKFGYQKN